MKNNKLFTLLCATIMLCSCGGNNNSSSTKKQSSTTITSSNSSISSSSTTHSTTTSTNSISSTSSSTSSINSTINPNFELPTSNEEILTLINGTSYYLAKNHESSYTYEKTSYPQKYDFEDFGYMTKETINSYRFVSHSSKEVIVEKFSSLDLVNYSSIYSYNGVIFDGNYNDKNIHLEKYDTSNVPGSEYITRENNISLIEIKENRELSDYLVSDLYANINTWVNSLEDNAIGTTLNNDGSVSLFTSIEKIEHQVMKTKIELAIELDINGFINHAKYVYKTYSYDWNINDYRANTTDHTIEEYSCNFSNELTDNDNLDLVNPEDYILVDAEIGFIENNSYNQALLDTNNIKANTSIKPFLISATPSTALDRTFTIVSSSNTDVIDESYGVWKCLLPGTTTLTLVNELGFEKLVNITVYTPALETINLSLATQNMKENNSYQLYVYGSPYDAISAFDIVSSDNDVADVTYEDGKYMINCKKEGTTTITVTSVEFPSISNSIEITVQGDNSDSSLSSVLTSTTWHVYSYNTWSEIYLNFYEDGRGQISDSYGDSSSFTWEIDGSTVTISEIYFNYNYYIENTIRIAEDGSCLYANFSDGFYTTLIETFDPYY